MITLPTESRFLTKIFYALVFLFSLLLFIFLSFPFAIVKENIVAEINARTPLQLGISALNPSLPVGLVAEDVSIQTIDGEGSFRLSSVGMKLQALRLFLAQAGISIHLESNPGESLDLDAHWSIFSILSGAILPSSVSVESSGFDLGPIADFGLKAASQQVNDLIKGVLQQMRVSGKLFGELDLDLSGSDLTSSNGRIELKVVDGILDLNDPNLAIEAQSFSKASVIATLKDGKLSFDPSGGFVTQDLTIDIGGDIQFAEPMTSSRLNLELSLELRGSLKTNFGFLLSMLGGGSEEKAEYKLTGSLAGPVFVPR